MELREQQEFMWRAVTAPQPQDVQEQFVGDDIAAATRIQVYRDMYRTRLGGALSSLFPRTAAVLGNRVFTRVGWAYLRGRYRHECSRNPLTGIEAIAHGFEDFLRAEALVNSGLSLAADVAAVELAILDVQSAADERALERFPTDMAVEDRLHFTSTWRVTSLGHVVCGRAWSELVDRNAFESESAEARVNYQLVTRAGYNASIFEIAAIEAAFLIQIGQGDAFSFAQIGEFFALRGGTPETVAAALRSWLDRGLLREVQGA